MLDEIKKIAAAFNQAASTYDQHARVQYETGRELIHQLTSISQDFNNILDAGCGTGRITNLLGEQVKYELIHAIDIAEKLLLSTTENFPAKTNRYLLDFNKITTLPTHYHLIFSNMALQWSTSLASTLSIFHNQLTRHGLLCFSLPLTGTFVEISENFSLHPLPTREKIEELLLETGYRIFYSHQQPYLDLFDCTLPALRSIKLTGASHTNVRNKAGLRGKACLTENPIRQLTYNIGFFIAEKLT